MMSVRTTPSVPPSKPSVRTPVAIPPIEPPSSRIIKRCVLICELRVVQILIGVLFAAHECCTVEL